MLPWILGAAGAVLAGLAMWLWSRMRKKVPEDDPNSKNPFDRSEPGSDLDSSSSKADDDSREKGQREQERLLGMRRDEFIRRIVDTLTFASRKENRPTPSPFPTSILEVRPMQGMSEISKVLPQATLTDDDVFFGLAASNQLPIAEHFSQEEAREALLLIIDVSPSMRDGDRISWAKQLAHEALLKCRAYRAQCLLVIFDADAKLAGHAINDDDLKRMSEDLDIHLSIGNGTSIDTALTCGIRIANEQKFTSTDMVLVTDGTEGIRVQETLDALTQNLIVLHTVCLGLPHDGLKSISSQYHHYQLE